MKAPHFVRANDEKIQSRDVTVKNKPKVRQNPSTCTARSEQSLAPATQSFIYFALPLTLVRRRCTLKTLRLSLFRFAEIVFSARGWPGNIFSIASFIKAAWARSLIVKLAMLCLHGVEKYLRLCLNVQEYALFANLNLQLQENYGLIHESQSYFELYFPVELNCWLLATVWGCRWNEWQNGRNSANVRIFLENAVSLHSVAGPLAT